MGNTPAGVAQEKVACDECNEQVTVMQPLEGLVFTGGRTEILLYTNNKGAI